MGLHSSGCSSLTCEGSGHELPNLDIICQGSKGWQLAAFIPVGLADEDDSIALLIPGGRVVAQCTLFGRAPAQHMSRQSNPRRTYSILQAKSCMCRHQALRRPPLCCSGLLRCAPSIAGTAAVGRHSRHQNKTVPASHEGGEMELWLPSARSSPVGTGPMHNNLAMYQAHLEDVRQQAPHLLYISMTRSSHPSTSLLWLSICMK